MSLERGTLTAPDDGPTSPPGSPDRAAEVEDASARSRRYMLAISIAYCGLLAVVLSRSWFISDDLENFGLARASGLTESYLRLNVFGHFAPAHRFLDWFVMRWWPLQWAAPALILSVALLGTAWTLHVIVRMLAPTRSWPTLLLLPFAASPLVLATAVWWAAAAHSVPAMLLGSLATLAAVRYDARPRRADVVLYTACLFGGLLFYEKSALVPLSILALLWARRSGGHAVRDVVDVLRRCRVLVVVTVLLLGAWALVVKLGDYNSGVPAPSPHVWWDWTVRLVTAGPFAGAAGVSPNDFEGTLRTVLLIAAGLVVVGVVTASLVRHRGAWRAWVYLLVAFLPGIVLTAYTRAASFGAGIASDFHYSPELAPVVVIAVTLAFTKARRRGGLVSERTGWRRADLGVALILIPIVALSVISDLRAVSHFDGATTHRFFTNLERSSRSFDLGADSPNRLLNTDVPFGIVPPAFEPFNQTAYVLDLLPATRPLRDDLDPRAPLLLVLPDGTMTRARLRPIGTLEATAGSCLDASTLTIPQSALPGDDRTTLFAVIDGTPVPTTVVVTTRADGGSRSQPVQGSADGRPVRLWASQAGRLKVEPLSGECLTRFVLLRPEPIEGARAAKSS